MSIHNKFKDLKDQKSYSNPAKRVMDHLKPILSKSNDIRQRWMWELLQNASDLGDNVKARFEISHDKLRFSHNGKPFLLDEAYNLIMPDSSKDDDANKEKSVIGQFGTGFISTHILSKIIEIEGIIEDENDFYRFNFHLDRSERTDKEFLIQSIKASESEYRDNLIKIDVVPNDDFHTTFIYHLDKTYSSLNGNEIVDDGITNFIDLIPFVMTFRPQLKEIEINDNRNLNSKLKFKREEVTSDINGLKIIKTVYLKNDTIIEEKLIGIITEEETEIAFSVYKIDDRKFQFQEYPENCPRLFCAFPMIGTSGFNFPVLVNSQKFIPNRERDGIELTIHDTENRKRLLEAKICYKNLLEIIQKHEWSNNFHICSLTNPIIIDYETKKWFIKDVFNPIKDLILNTKLIELDNSLGIDDKRICLNSAFIPYADQRKKDKNNIVDIIYEFASKTIPYEIPCKEHYLNWYHVLDFEIFDKEKLDLEKLCEIVTSNNNLTDFGIAYNMSEKEGVKYFYNLIELLIKEQELDLLGKYNLLLNQNNKFTKLKGLKLDKIYYKGLKDNYNEKLKDIYNTLSGKECREVLLHKELETINFLIEKDENIDFKELSKDTDEELRNFNGNFHNEDFLMILKDLFYWYTTCGLSEETLKNSFPFFAHNKSQLYLNTKTPKELEYAFDIEISGKSEVLAKLANSSLSEDQLDIIANNTNLITNFIDWINSKQQDYPDEELGNIGEEFLYQSLCQIFGRERVLWENKPEYDFRILEKDTINTKYYIDAKTTGKGIANCDNVPFFMRLSQWNFLDNQLTYDKYIIARVFKNQDSTIGVKYLKINNLNTI